MLRTAAAGGDRKVRSTEPWAEGRRQRAKGKRQGRKADQFLAFCLPLSAPAFCPLFLFLPSASCLLLPARYWFSLPWERGRLARIPREIDQIAGETPAFPGKLNLVPPAQID